MKFFISILLALTCHISFAADHSGGHKEEAQHEKDWNEVFKQPVTNKDLAVLPPQTELLEPSFLADVKGTDVTLKWKPVEGVKYHLQVATDPNFKWLITNEPLVDYTEYNLKGLQPNQQYFWRVYTQKPDNTRAYTKSSGVTSEFETY